MEIAEDLGMNAYDIAVDQIRAIVLKLLGLSRPFYVPSIDELNLPDSKFDQVILVIIDNFSLFEVISYQPRWMIKNLDNLLLIKTESKADSLTEPMLASMFYNKESLTFNLLSALKSNAKHAKVIAREEDIPKITKETSLVLTEKSDVNIYVKGLKSINRNDFLVMHFSDFDEMYEKYSMNPPADIAQKIMKRTDKWLSLFWQQSIEGTALIVVGNDGRKPIDMNLEGHAVAWKKANLPIGFIKF